MDTYIDNYNHNYKIIYMIFILNIISRLTVRSDPRWLKMVKYKTKQAIKYAKPIKIPKTNKYLLKTCQKT